MANIRSAAKRAKQTAQRTLRNKSVLTGLKRQQKKLTAAVASGDGARAQEELNLLASRLDKAGNFSQKSRESSQKQGRQGSRRCQFDKTAGLIRSESD